MASIQLHQQEMRFGDSARAGFGHLFLVLVGDNGEPIESLHGQRSPKKPDGRFDMSLDAPSASHFPHVSPLIVTLKRGLGLGENLGSVTKSENGEEMPVSVTLASGSSDEISAIWQRGVAAAREIGPRNRLYGIACVEHGATNGNAVAYGLMLSMGLVPPPDIHSHMRGFSEDVHRSKDGFLDAPGYGTDIRTYLPPPPSKAVTNFSYQRTAEQAAVWYFAFLLIGLLIGGVIAGFAGFVVDRSGFEVGRAVAKPVNIAYLLIVGYLLLQDRPAGVINVLLVLIAPATGAFLGLLGGLIPLAVLTTRPLEEVTFR